MTQQQHNPETGEPIRSLQEYDRIVREVATAQPPITLPPAEVADDPGLDPLQLRLEQMRASVGSNTVKLAETTANEREDPWASLGGGTHTYREQGHLPIGIASDVIERRITRRGGSVARLTLNGRYLDVPISETGSNAEKLQTAREDLAAGLRGNRLPRKR